MFGSKRGNIDTLSFPEIANGPLICVTGGTGQLGSHVALSLCRAGFKVRCTSRSPEKVTSMQEKWPGAAIDWVIISDHAFEGSYDKAFEGCEGVINCAGPFTFKISGSQIIEQNLKGVQNILKAAAKVPKLKRIVHFSSVAAVFQHDADITNQTSGIVYDETCVLNDQLLARLKERGETLPGYAYNYSKTQGERLITSWRADNDHNFDVVTLCPCTLYGPVAQAWKNFDDLDAASDRLWHYINEAKVSPPSDRWPVYTSVLDAAEIAIKSFLYPVAANKRYLIISGEYTYAKIFSIIRQNFPEHAHRLPEVLSEIKRCEVYTVDTTKVERDLSMRHWTSLEETIIPHARALFELEERVIREASAALQ